MEYANFLGKKVRFCREIVAEAVASDVQKLTRQEVHTIEEINNALDVYNEQHEAEDKFCCFHEFKYVEE